MQVSRIILSGRLMREIRLTADLVSEIAGRDIECEGLIVSDYGNDYAKYSHIPEQDAAYASCSSQGIEKIFSECYKRNQRVLGVWHSHGSFGVFHSGFDDAHLGTTLIPMAERYSRMLGAKPHYPSKDTIEDVLVSVVVNSKDEKYYAEEFHGKDSVQVLLNIEEDSGRIDEESLVRNIGQNVRHGGLLLSQYPGYKNILKKYEGRFRKELSSSRLQKVAQATNIDSILDIVAGKSSWRWEDRMREFETEYIRLRNAQNIHAKVPRIEAILGGNSYLISNHYQIYSGMKYKLSELKYRSWFKEVRKQRHKAKTQILSRRSQGHAAACSRQTQS